MSSSRLPLRRFEFLPASILQPQPHPAPSCATTPIPLALSPSRPLTFSPLTCSLLLRCRLLLRALASSAVTLVPYPSSGRTALKRLLISDHQLPPEFIRCYGLNLWRMVPCVIWCLRGSMKLDLSRTQYIFLFP